jgi:hypothetical protein
MYIYRYNIFLIGFVAKTKRSFKAKAQNNRLSNIRFIQFLLHLSFQ